MEFTEAEKQLLLQLLSQIQLSPLSPDAAKSVELIQSIAAKIGAEKDGANMAGGG